MHGDFSNFVVKMNSSDFIRTQNVLGCFEGGWNTSLGVDASLVSLLVFNNSVNRLRPF